MQAFKLQIDSTTIIIGNYDLYRDFAAAAASFGCKSLIVLNPSGIPQAEIPEKLVRAFEKYSLRATVPWTAGTSRTATPMVLAPNNETLLNLLQPSIFSEEEFRVAYDKACKWQREFEFHKVYSSLFLYAIINI